MCLSLKLAKDETHIVLYRLWVVYTLYSLTAHNSLFLVAESL